MPRSIYWHPQGRGEHGEGRASDTEKKNHPNTTFSPKREAGDRLKPGQAAGLGAAFPAAGPQGGPGRGAQPCASHPAGKLNLAG